MDLFNLSKQQFASLTNPNFKDNKKKLDQELLAMSTQIKSISKMSQVTLRTKMPKSAYESMTAAANRHSTVDSDFVEYSTIRYIIEKTYRYSGTASMSKCTRVFILDIAACSTSELYSLLTLFVSDIPQSATRPDMERQLRKFIPITTVQAPPTPKCKLYECTSCAAKPKFYQTFNKCYWCSKPFCRNCPLKQYRYPRIGSIQELCSNCVNDLARADTEEWEEFSIKFLAKTDDSSIMASLGCTSVAIALGSNPLELLKKLARELHNKNQHDIAYSIISLAISMIDDRTNTKQQMKLHILASSVLLALAKNTNKAWKEKWYFAFASKEAYFMGISLADTKTDILSTRKKEVDRTICALFEEKQKEHKLIISQYEITLENLWSKKDIPGILNFLKQKNIEDDGTATIIKEESAYKKVFCNFLKSKKPHLLKMRPDDRCDLEFLEGIMQLKENSYITAFESIESAAWKHVHSIPDDVILGACLHTICKEDAEFYSYKALKEIFRGGLEVLLFTTPKKQPNCDRSMTLLFPSSSELTPPFEENWPSLAVVGHNARCHQIYEEAVLKFYNEKEWTCHQVAWAYLDEIPGCEHPAEKVVCCLHAAMWLAKQLEPKSQINPETVFGLKCVIMKVIKFAFCVTVRVLNPGMELYMIRLAIGLVSWVFHSRTLK